MNPSLRRRLLLGVLFGFIVILALFLASDIRQVSSRLAGFRWLLMPLILAGTLFNYSLRFLKWHYYLGLVSAGPLRWPRSLKLFIAGFPLAVTPGKVGEALKAVWLRLETGTPFSTGVTIVLAERISDGLAVLVLSLLGVITYPRYWPAFVSVLAALLAIVLLSQIPPAAYWMINLIESLPGLGRFGQSLRHFYESSRMLFRPIPTVFAVLLGSTAWFGEGLAMYLILLGLGVTAGIDTLVLAVFTLSFSTIIGAVSALPGGLGAAELSIAGMLSFLLGLDGGTAGAATLLIRFATLWFGVGLGLAVWTRSGDWLLLETESPAQGIPPS